MKSVLVALVASVAVSAFSNSLPITWGTDYKAALAKAKKVGKPVLIWFYADT